VQLARTLVLTAQLRPEDDIDYALEDMPLAKVSSGVGGAVSACQAAVSSTRVAFAQFFERQGAVGSSSRLRLVVRWDIGGGDVGALSGLPKFVDAPSQASLPLASRNVYMPRQPADVVAAMESYDQHGRLGERTRIEWLVRRVGGKARVDEVAATPTESYAASLGVNPTHAGELVTSALVDIYCAQVIDRQVRAARSKLADTPEERAAAELQRASRLSNAAFEHSSHSLPTRIDDDDALFECYSGGKALRLALRESAMWRRWAPRPATAGMTRLEQARLVHLAAGEQTGPAPLHLREVAAALSKRAPSRARDGSILEAPFLSASTLMFGHALPEGRRAMPMDQLGAAWSGLARILALAESMNVRNGHIAALLVDAVYARPIIDIAMSSYARALTSPEMQGLADALDRPLEVITADDLQPQLRDDVLGVVFGELPLVSLRRRLARMRLDTHDVANGPLRPIETDVDALTEMFLDLSTRSGPCEYLIPFAAGAPQTLHPAIHNVYGFEQTPVFVSQVLKELDNGIAPTPLPSGPRVRIESAEVCGARAAPTHPMVITAQKRSNTNPEVAVGVQVVMQSNPRLAVPNCDAQGYALFPNAPGSPPRSIAVAFAASHSSSNGRGEAVDAANGVLWSIERLLQAILVAISVGGVDDNPPSLIWIGPPPQLPPPSKDVPASIADEPDDLKALRLHQLKLALEVHDFVIKEKTAWDVSKTTIKNATIFLMLVAGANKLARSLSPPPDEPVTEEEYAPILERLFGSLPPMPSMPSLFGTSASIDHDLSDVYIDPKSGQRISDGEIDPSITANEATAAYPDDIVQLQAEVAGRRVADADGLIVAFEEYVESNRDYLVYEGGTQAKVKYDSYNANKQTIARAETNHQQNVADRDALRASIQAENATAATNAADAYKEQMYAWPLIVATAVALAQGVLKAELPTFVHDYPAGMDEVATRAETRALLEAARDRGVKAVPLSEWAAVLARRYLSR